MKTAGENTDACGGKPDAALVTVAAKILRDETLEPDVRLRVLGELVSMEERTLEGQALDLGWARDGRWDVSTSDYLCMASHKTAFYSAATPLSRRASTWSFMREIRGDTTRVTPSRARAGIW